MEAHFEVKKETDNKVKKIQQGFHEESLDFNTRAADIDGFEDQDHETTSDPGPSHEITTHNSSQARISQQSSETSIDDDESRNFEAIKTVATKVVPGDHGQCVTIDALAQGSFHTVYILRFEDGWECLARFPKTEQPPTLIESEVATMKTVKENTSIPVPEVYHVCESACSWVILEYLPGQSLASLWDELSVDHKKAALAAIAEVVAQLATIRSDRIGCLSPEQETGPLIERGFTNDGIGPFDTVQEYFLGLINSSKCLTCCPQCRGYCFESWAQVEDFLEGQRETELGTLCKSPFVLMHGDLGFQNMLFAYDPRTDEPPRLSGVIDWDSSSFLSRYYLLDPPYSLLDSEVELKEHYLQTLLAKLPNGVKHQRENLLDQLPLLFPGNHCTHREQRQVLKKFLGREADKDEKIDWEKWKKELDAHWNRVEDEERQKETDLFENPTADEDVRSLYDGAERDLEIRVYEDGRWRRRTRNGRGSRLLPEGPMLR